MKSQPPSLTRSLPLAVLTLLLTAHCSLLTGYAQSTTATLSGTVVDQNGAVVPGTNITVTNNATRQKREATTNEQGDFTVPLLPPATYTVNAQHDGFAPVEFPRVVLNVGDNKALQIQLKAGGVNAMVQINTDAPLINESPTVGTVIDRQFVENLPLNGRSFQSLINLTPGVVLARAAGDNPGQFSVNGQRTNTNYFSVDGVSANIGTSPASVLNQVGAGSQPGLTALGGTNNLVSVDALQEFKIQTSIYAPEFGRSPGAQIQIITRSGTNEFHGAAFEYFRNDALDASDWFANATRQQKPPLRQNDFGFVLGGPVMLPGYSGRNRTFFFFSYEGLRLRQPQVAANAEVPSLATRQNAAAAMRPLLNAFPVPNGATLANGLALFSGSFSNPATLDATSIRIDHTAKSKLTLFGRYNVSPSNTVARTNPRSLSNLNTTEVNTTTLTFGATLIASASINNDLRVNFSRVEGKNVFASDNFGGATPFDDALWFPTFATREDAQMLLSINVSTRPTLRIGRTSDNLQRQFNLVDTFSVNRGNHQIKFGGDYRRMTPVYGPLNYQQEGVFTTIAQVLSGVPNRITVRAFEEVSPRYTNLSLFAQDTWKATPRLTLTFGARWEINPPPSEPLGRQTALTNIASPATVTLAPVGTPLYKTTYNNLAPRFGAAFVLRQDPGRETVIRGGVGVFYDLGSTTTGDTFLGLPFFGSRNLAAGTPFPVTNATTAAPAPIVVAPPFAGLVGVDPQLKLPRTYQLSVGVEQSLGRQQVVSATYVGALGRRLLQARGYIAPSPNVAFLQITTNSARSDYHALQLQFERRLSRGLQALASYTWSHSIDDASSELQDVNQSRGPSDFDMRHSFSAALTYNIPAISKSPFVNAISREWAVDLIARSQSATPVTIIAVQSATILGVLQNFRPDVTPGIPLYLTDPTAPGGRRFNNTVDPARPGCKGPFCPPAAGRQGSLGRNALRGFPLNQLDLSLRRQFTLTERFKVQFRGDLFNIFNHPNFADPNNLLTSPTFGVSNQMLAPSLGRGGLSGGFNPLYQAGGARSVQLSFKVLF